MKKEKNQKNMNKKTTINWGMLIWTLIIVVLVMILIIFSFTAYQDFVSNGLKKECIRSEKTFFYYQEGPASFFYCGDVQDLARLVEQLNLGLNEPILLGDLG